MEQEKGARGSETMTKTAARNARRDAADLVGAGTTVRVLEPSPPAVHDGDWFADDPANAPGPPPVVSPTGAVAGSAQLSWADLVERRPELCDFAAKNWLACFARLEALPSGFADARTALHRLAAYVIAPARHRENGKFGLRWTNGGYGTPFFGDDRQIRVELDQLIVQHGDQAQTEPITTLRAAAEFIASPIDTETAAEHDSPALGDIDETLTINSDAVHALSQWWGMGTAALERLRADDASVNASRVQLWPGHFDPAIEVGDESRRGSYGASPGDATSDEPYLYVSVWWPDRLVLDNDDPFWNADGYAGARLPYAELLAAADPVEAAFTFFSSGRDRLVASCLIGQAQ